MINVRMPLLLLLADSPIERCPSWALHTDHESRKAIDRRAMLLQGFQKEAIGFHGLRKW